MANPRATRFVFEIAGNPATTPTKIRQLGAVPFFLMGPDHPLFLLLPDALNTTVLRLYPPHIYLSHETAGVIASCDDAP